MPKILTVPEVKKIKKSILKGTKLGELGEKFGVAVSTISWIATGRSWRDVEVEGWKKSKQPGRIALAAKAPKRKGAKFTKVRKKKK